MASASTLIVAAPSSNRLRGFSLSLAAGRPGEAAIGSVTASAAVDDAPAMLAEIAEQIEADRARRGPSTRKSPEKDGENRWTVTAARKTSSDGKPAVEIEAAIKVRDSYEKGLYGEVRIRMRMAAADKNRLVLAFAASKRDRRGTGREGGKTRDPPRGRSGRGRHGRHARPRAQWTAYFSFAGWTQLMGPLATSHEAHGTASDAVNEELTKEYLWSYPKLPPLGVAVKVSSAELCGVGHPRRDARGSSEHMQHLLRKYGPLLKAAEAKDKETKEKQEKQRRTERGGDAPAYGYGSYEPVTPRPPSSTTETGGGSNYAAPRKDAKVKEVESRRSKGKERQEDNAGKKGRWEKGKCHSSS